MKTLFRAIASLLFGVTVSCLFLAIWVGDVRFLWTATLTLILATVAVTASMQPPTSLPALPREDAQVSTVCWAKTPHSGPADHPRRMFMQVDGDLWQDENGWKFRFDQLVDVRFIR